MYRRILELAWHWNVEPVLRAWHKKCTSTYCGLLYSAPQFLPKALPPKGMIGLDPVVRTRGSQVDSPAVLLSIEKVSRAQDRLGLDRHIICAPALGDDSSRRNSTMKPIEILEKELAKAQAEEVEAHKEFRRDANAGLKKNG
jgi:hypothetical protein